LLLLPLLLLLLPLLVLPGLPADASPVVDRGVFGFVPCFPERVALLTDRLLPVGDSAGNR
jgi:hypothetical protein